MFASMSQISMGTIDNSPSPTKKRFNPQSQHSMDNVFMTMRSNVPSIIEVSSPREQNNKVDEDLDNGHAS